MHLPTGSIALGYRGTDLLTRPPQHHNLRPSATPQPRTPARGNNPELLRETRSTTVFSGSLNFISKQDTFTCGKEGPRMHQGRGPRYLYSFINCE